MRLILGLLLLFTTTLIAEPVREGAVITELVCSKQSIAPGETIDIALRIKHDKGWHTYWKSPGIVGVPAPLENLIRECRPKDPPLREEPATWNTEARKSNLLPDRSGPRPG